MLCMHFFLGLTIPRPGRNEPPTEVAGPGVGGTAQCATTQDDGDVPCTTKEVFTQLNQARLGAQGLDNCMATGTQFLIHGKAGGEKRTTPKQFHGPFQGPEVSEHDTRVFQLLGGAEKKRRKQNEGPQ